MDTDLVSRGAYLQRSFLDTRICECPLLVCPATLSLADVNVKSADKKHGFAFNHKERMTGRKTRINPVR